MHQRSNFGVTWTRNESDCCGELTCEMITCRVFEVTHYLKKHARSLFVCLYKSFDHPKQSRRTCFPDTKLVIMSSLDSLTSNEKRRHQNRIAQRKFRNKKKAHEVQMMQEKNRMAEKEEKLLSEIASLRARLGRNAVVTGSSQRMKAVEADDTPPEYVLG